MKADKHVTVEKTAKRYKLALLIFGLMSAIGMGMAVVVPMYGDPANISDGIKFAVGVAMLLVGLIGWLITKLLIWWNHG